jgi:hypothetical protein
MPHELKRTALYGAVYDADQSAIRMAIRQTLTDHTAQAGDFPSRVQHIALSRETYNTFVQLAVPQSTPDISFRYLDNTLLVAGFPAYIDDRLNRLTDKAYEVVYVR